MPNLLRLYFAPFDSRWIFGRGALALSAIPLVVGDLYELQLQAVRSPIFRVNADGTARDTDCVSIADDAHNIVVGLKTPQQFRSKADFTEAWAGFYQDSDWHDPDHGRAAVRLTLDPDTALTEYFLNAVLLDALGNPYHIGSNLIARAIQRLRLGAEATLPTSATGGWFDDAIPAGANFKDVEVPGMTAAGAVVPVLKGSSAAFTTLSYICSTNNVRIISAANAPDDGTFEFGFRVDHK